MVFSWQTQRFWVQHWFRMRCEAEWLWVNQASWLYQSCSGTSLALIASHLHLGWCMNWSVRLKKDVLSYTLYGSLHHLIDLRASWQGAVVTRSSEASLMLTPQTNTLFPPQRPVNEEKSPVGPWLLALFVFVVCGSGEFQLIYCW